MNKDTTRRLGNYRLVRLLGRGGFGRVYLGEHIYLNTPAAIKVLHTHLSQEESMRFLTEARLIAGLEHPNIVRILDFGMEGYTPYLVMPYAPNGTLHQRHPRGTPLPLPLIVQYVQQIADGLQYAHDLKLIHRDIKPENLLLGRKDEVLLSDFGLAIVSQSSVDIQDQGRAGTTLYMAPEQLQGKPSRASDQYALGIVTYEWLCGHAPFLGTEYEIAMQHIQTPPPPLHELIPTIPPIIEQVVMRTLAKSTDQRFPQVQEFAQALAQAYHRALLDKTTVAKGQEISKISTQLEARNTFRSEKFNTTGTPETPDSSVDIPQTTSHAEIIASTPHLPVTPRTTETRQVKRSETSTISQNEARQHHQELSVSPLAINNSYNKQQDGPVSSPLINSLHNIDNKRQDGQILSTAGQSLSPSPIQTQKIASQIEQPLPQNTRRSRRKVVAGLIGTVMFGAGALWYLFDHPQPTSQGTIATQTPPGGNTTLNGAAGTGTTRTPKATQTGNSTQITTSSPASTTTTTTKGQGTTTTATNSTTSVQSAGTAQPTSPGSTIQPTTTQPTSPATSASNPTPTSQATPTQTTALTVQIDTGSLSLKLTLNSTYNVTVITNKANIPVVLHVSYSTGDTQALGPQYTGANGKTTFIWTPGVKSLLGISVVTATLTANGTNTDGQTVDSNSVQLTLTSL